MAESENFRTGRVPAHHGNLEWAADPDEELDMATTYRTQHDPEELVDLFSRCSVGTDEASGNKRRALLRALSKSFGHGVHIGCGVSIRHPETFEIGDGVFIGDQTVLHGQINGRCHIGKGSWIGPQSYFDARDLVIGEFVGWAPGAKALGSAHTGQPLDIPIVGTDLDILPVRIGDWADVGINAVIMPGVSIGKGSIIGAGAVVTHDVPAMVKAAGVPARVIADRDGGDG